MTDLTKEWLYWGCAAERSAGHYLFTRGMRTVVHHKPFSFFDGLLAPQDDSTAFVACITRFGSLGMTALSFWDYTGDSRPGSNSTIFAPSATCEPTAIMLGAAQNFPSAYARWPGITIRALK